MKNVIIILSVLISNIYGQDLFFSEYIEGSSSNKALEIYNPTDAAVDLAGYEIWRISNGGDWAEGEENAVDLNGYSVDAGDVFVICNSSIAEEYAGECDILGTTATYYNGDDAVGLAYNGTLIDAVGEAGDDPGSGWAVAGVTDATKDHTLVRKSSVTQGNTDWASSSGTDVCDSEWNVYDQNTFDYLGSHDVGSGNVAPVANAGPDQVVDPEETVQLDGSGSYDPECAEISFSWDGPGDIMVDDPSSATPLFTAPSYSETTLLTFTLTVTDDQGGSDSDITEITVFVEQGLTIAEARALGVGEIVTVQGVVTTPNFQSSHTEYVIQDATAGLVVFGYGVTDVDLDVGDEIRVTGETEEYNGKFEVAITGSQDITVLGTADLPEPQIITVAELTVNGEEYESELITIQNVNLYEGDWPDEGVAINLIITDDNGASTVIMRIDSDTEIDGSPEPSWPQHVTGVGGQYSNDYQILPRFITDFEPAGDNQYPVADAGEDQLVNPGDLVTLDGSSSFDSDGSVEGYLWAQTEGTAVTLSDTEPEDGIATFTAPSVDGNVVLTFSLTVEDNLGDTGTDFISIVISGGETSIYDIQYTTVQGDYCFDSPLMGEVVVTSGVVTAVQNPGSYSNFYVQDFGYDSWSGAYVYDNTQSPVVGDEVTFAATVLEYYSFTELTDLIGFSVASSGNAVTPKDITTGELADGCTFIGEALEGMLVRVTDVEVVAESDDNGEWYVDDGTGLCQIDDGMFDGTPPTPVAGTHFTAIVGVVDYSFSLFGVLPRSSDDIQSESNVTEVSVDYLTGWNMVGLPLEVEDTYYQTLFPDAFNNAMYSFNGSYSPVEYLVLGTGYLIRLSDGGTVEFSGTTIDELTISLTEGWNLISGISTSLPVDVLYNSGLVVSNGIYAFDGSYYNASTIDPGMGYWVRALADGDVTLSSSSSMGRTVPIVNHFVDANILELSNGTHSSTLYFGKDVAEEHRNSYSLPPTFPQMAFDVRFNGDMKYTVESGDIEVLNTSDNLTISYDIVIEAGEHMNWVLSSESGKEYTLKGTDEITIPSAERFVLYRGSVIPITFALHQNYPNPFNPVTKITYQLPEESYVVISIYNLIGQKIVDLVSEVQQKGHHKVMWDSKDAKSNLVSSGVYFYSITAGDHTALKKMVLMK
ncbi:MAG: lamin tail domain-containing protein [Candidatus Marinimicrobia bacterium]|nr:lamin tail domain-containing protein [Candidatus Neomarinimicrobiota bacterium]